MLYFKGLTADEGTGAVDCEHCTVHIMRERLNSNVFQPEYELALRRDFTDWKSTAIILVVHLSPESPS